MTDKHYTPVRLADVLVEAVPFPENAIVFDPAAGRGSLLEAAVRAVGNGVTVLAADSDGSAVGYLRRAHRDWTVSLADLTRTSSRRASRAWGRARSGVDVVLLNPPFSYRGGAGRQTMFGSDYFRLSPAAEFTALTLSELKPTVGVWAILPHGVLHGEKHTPFWTAVARDYRIDEIQAIGDSTFSRVRARTSIVSFTPLPALGRSDTTRPSESVRPSSGACMCVEIVRGRIPRHREFLTRGSLPYAHTSDLRDYSLITPSVSAPEEFATRGTFVLIPRVGVPSGKIALVTDGALVLSDCLFALRPTVATNAKPLLDALTSKRLHLSNSYGGTGARYLTISALKQVLRDLGWQGRHVAASSEPGACWCGAVGRQAA